MFTKLSSKVCRYRGYTLDAGQAGFQEVEKLFRVDEQVKVDEEEEAAAGGEDPEESPKLSISRKLNTDLCPAFVVVTQAPEAFCRAKWQKRNGALPEFQQKMEMYKKNNPEDASGGVMGLADFFQEYAKIGVFNLPVPGKDDEDLFESTRIYMESAGRPFNYLPSEEEVAREILARRAEKEDQEINLNETQTLDVVAEQAKLKKDKVDKQAERMRIIAKHMEQHQELKDMPLREYLMRYMVPSLTEGLIEMCKVVPENPVDYLATYLEQQVESGTLSTEKAA
jgi:adenylate kinase